MPLSGGASLKAITGRPPSPACGGAFPLNIVHQGQDFGRIAREGCMRRLELPFKIFSIVHYLVDKIKKEYRKVNESS